MTTELIRKASVEEVCAHRDRAVEMYRQAFACLDEARAAHGRAAPHHNGGLTSLPDFRYKKTEEVLTAIFLDLDRDMWRSFLTGTQLETLMDQQERERFIRTIQDGYTEEDGDEVDRGGWARKKRVRLPEATAENLRATFERLIGDADAIFRRGLVNAFTSLCRDYKSNDGFKLGDRIVLTYGCVYEGTSIQGFRLNYHTEGRIVDVDRVMHVLDGKKPPERGSEGLQSALYGAMRQWKNGDPTEVRTEYWRARFFKNGNIHLWPLREDLIDRANKLIAEHFGEVLPAGHDVHNQSPDYRPTEHQAREEDFFATPPEVVDLVLAEAGIGPTDSVLEPSAGDGAIAVPIAEMIGAERLTCIERNAGRAGELRSKLGILANVQAEDFLSVPPARTFTKAVMNPPFGSMNDVRHVLHALRFLAPGGRLVAIMSAGIQYRTDRLSTHLREQIDARGGSIQLLPEGSFKASGTGVRTVLVTIPA